MQKARSRREVRWPARQQDLPDDSGAAAKRAPGTRGLRRGWFPDPMAEPQSPSMGRSWHPHPLPPAPNATVGRIVSEFPALAGSQPRPPCLPPPVSNARRRRTPRTVLESIPVADGRVPLPSRRCDFRRLRFHRAALWKYPSCSRPRSQARTKRPKTRPTPPSLHQSGGHGGGEIPARSYRDAGWVLRIPERAIVPVVCSYVVGQLANGGLSVNDGNGFVELPLALSPVLRDEISQNR